MWRWITSQKLQQLHQRQQLMRYSLKHNEQYLTSPYLHPSQLPSMPTINGSRCCSATIHCIDRSLWLATWVADHQRRPNALSVRLRYITTAEQDKVEKESGIRRVPNTTAHTAVRFYSYYIRSLNASEVLGNTADYRWDEFIATADRRMRWLFASSCCCSEFMLTVMVGKD